MVYLVKTKIDYNKIFVFVSCGYISNESELVDFNVRLRKGKDWNDLRNACEFDAQTEDVGSSKSEKDQLYIKEQFIEIIEPVDV